jgi:phosphoglycerate dehydrogenase-like enzyme
VSSPLRVLNQMGPRVGDKIAEAVPGVEVADVSAGDDRGAVEGDVVLAVATSPDLPDLARRAPWVHAFGTGVDGMAREVFEGRVVTCSRGASAVPIAEYVMAAMLAVEKQLPESWVTEAPERWGWARHGTLEGRVLGLVGLGGIGTAVARRALAFDMEVVAARRTAAPSPVEGVTVASGLEEVLAAADHLVLAAPATPRTTRLIDAAALEQVEPGVHVVNVARGGLVDQEALRSALDDGRVAMATLDVTDPEPLPPGHWMYGHPRVRVSPHVSWSSPTMTDRIVELFVANLRRRMAGEPLDGVVDPEEGY